MSAYPLFVLFVFFVDELFFLVLPQLTTGTRSVSAHINS
jgi:hypothetical protein